MAEKVGRRDAGAESIGRAKVGRVGFTGAQSDPLHNKHDDKCAECSGGRLSRPNGVASWRPSSDWWGFDLAEEAAQEAFTAAVDQWARDGVPEFPRA